MTSYVLHFDISYGHFFGKLNYLDEEKDAARYLEMKMEWNSICRL